jgi:ATP-dependent DNA helicase DinG
MARVTAAPADPDYKHPMSSAAADALAVLDRAVVALGGDERPGQRRLVTAVAEAIEGSHHLLAEAPTGSGKSLAYLAPLIASGMRAVVATATLALQDQLWRKDLPHLQQHGGIPFTTALLKGRANYLCLAKLAAARGDNALFDERPSAAFANDLERLERFAVESQTGDGADLGDSVDATSWRAVTCGPNECPGASKCEQGPSCFAEIARQQATEVDVLVVNHALYCAHLAAGGYVLPEHDVVVFDEAHALDRIATGALGSELSAGSLRNLAARLRRLDAPATTVGSLAESAERVDDALAELEGRVDPTAEPLARALAAVGERLTSAARSVDREAGGVIAAQVARLATSRLDAVRQLQSPGADEVVWVEGGDRRVLKLAPIGVGPRLAPLLFSRIPTVLVSATLGPGPRFEPLARTLGLDPRGELGRIDDDGDDLMGSSPELGLGYVDLHVESPFDHREQALLYVPRDLPDVRDAGWEAAAGIELCELVGAAGGRTLVLCTSWRVVDAFTALLRERTGHRVLRQGEEPPARLIDAFAQDETSCLVATRAFWMGLDVPGPSCVLVVIDRLPFTRPDEPLEQARREAAERDGGDGFLDVDLPATALVLAQGAGRLVRGHADRGVVAVLDRRLATARYREVLLDALPPMRRVIDGEVAREFLATASGA